MKSSEFLILAISFLFINTAFSQDTLVLQPGPEGKDAFLDDWYTTPYGDYPNMFALAGTSNGSPVMMRSICEFDLSQIPPGSYVFEAKLSFYFANNPSVPHYHYGFNTALLQRVIEPWHEAAVTWYNQPATTEENQVILPQSTSPDQDYIDIDTRDLFQDIVNDPENSHGFLFRMQTEIMYCRLMFASSDYQDPAKRPKLEIIYLECIPPTVNFEYQVAGQSVSFTGISPTAKSWHWDFGDGDSSNIQNPEHYYEEPGFYQVCLVVEDTCYFAENCEEIEICTGPPEAGFTYTTDDLTVFFQDTSVMAGEYYWDFGDGYFSNLSNPIHTYDTQENYQVCLTTWNACGADTACEMLYLTTVFIPETGNGTFMVYPNPARDLVFIKTTLSGPAEFSLLDLSGKEVLQKTMDITADEAVDIPLGPINPGLYIVRFDSGKNQSFGKLVIAR